jgi:hypothetical protein
MSGSANTALGCAFRQPLDYFGVIDAYWYESAGNYADIYQEFHMGGVEQQAQIFEDFVRAEIWPETRASGHFFAWWNGS